MRNTTGSFLLRYGCAVLSVAVATGLRRLLDPVLEDKFPFATLFLAVLVAAWYGGFGPAMTATVLGALASAYVLLPPRGSFAVHGFENIAGMVLYLVLSLAIGMIGGAMRTARLRAERAEESQRAQRDELHVTLKSIGDAVITTDQHGRVKFLNAVAQRLTGWTQEEAHDLPLESVFKIVNEQSRQPVENPVAKVLQEGKVVGLANHTILIARDGTERPIDDSAAPIRDEQGVLRGVVLVFRDISDRKRAEANVRRAGEQARTILESITDAFCALDRDWRFVYVNRQAEVLLGRSRDDLLGKGHWQEYPATVGTEVDRNYRRAVSENAAVSFEFYFPPHARWYEVNAYPSGDGLSVYFRDISKRKGAEAALRESEARKSAILETALDCIITVDHEGKVVEFNPAAERTFGYSRSGVIGRELGSLIVPLRMREAHQKGMAHYLETGEGPVLGKRLELPAVRADGTEFPVELAITLIPTDGPPLFTAYLRDIGERKRVEAELARRTEEADQQRRIYETALSNTADFNYVFDLQGRFIYVNKSLLALWQRTLPEALGKTFSELDYPPELAARLHSQIRQVIDTKQPLRDETPYTSVVGERRYEYIFLPVYAADGEVEAVAGSTRDVTDQKLLERELRDARNRLEEALAAGAIATWIWEIPTDRVYADDKLADWFSVSPQDAAGGPLASYVSAIHPDDRSRVSDTIAGAVEAGGDYEADYRIAPPGVPPRWVVARGRVERDATRPLRMAGVLVDITARKQAEAAQIESEEKFRLLADTIPQLAWMARPDGYIFWYNRRWYEYTGTTPEEMEGWGWQSVHDPEALPKVLERWKGSIASGEPFDMVFPLKGADGLFRPFLTRVNPLRAEDGRILYWFGTNTDISDQVEAEGRVRESEQRFRQLADAMPQIVWTARPDGNIDYMNRRWTEFAGLPESLGNEGWGQILHPDDAPAANERWAGSVLSGAPFEMEMRLLDRRRQAYRWHLIRTVAVHDGAGKVTRWFGTSTDINDQKRAGESSRYLAEASAALAGVVDYESTLQKVANLAVPYFADWSAVDVANDDGSLRRLAVAHQDADKVRLAHELMKDYPPDPQAPGGAFAVLRTGRPEIVAEITDDMLVQGARDERHLRLIRSLGLRSYICVPLVVSGNPLGVLTFATAESGRTYTDADLALANDLAQRAGVAIENTQLYQALREADRRKDEFLATLAHELRNPLAPIRNALQILKMPRVDAKTIERSRDMMERQVHHLVRLVDDLLDVSRVMRGKIELRREKVELATVVARAVETVQPLIDTQGHELSVRLPSESLPLDADPVRLAQVVGNLLTNAAKYTEPGGRIWLTAERDGHEAVLRIRDTGIGIAPDILPRIFELFVQVDHAATRSQGGLGIGLTLVKNLCEMHNGSVEARSAGLGQGSEFVVRLPLSFQSLRENPGPESAVAPSPPLSSGHRLLVVDDNRDAADSLAMLLRLQGHEVRVAHSGPAALEMTKGYAPDVAFLDIGMPGMDGYEVARRLRQQPGLEKVVLAALTGWGQQEDRRRTAEAGFDHHLVKPPEPKAVEGVLAQLKHPDVK